ncbi:MAG: LeuA family protein [Chloroflexota bacterium]
MTDSQQPWKSENWFVSPWNFLPEVTKDFNPPARVRIHDVTLRDGEQQAGIVFTKDEKIRIAEELAAAGIHRIEAGTPAVSPNDEAAIKEIVRRKLGPEIFVLSRCMIDDVKRAVDCGVDGVTIEIPSSEHLVEHSYKWSMEKATDLSIKATSYAHEQGLYVSFFPVDATRSNIDWFLKLIQRVAAEGHMDALGLVDTFGVLSPHGASFYTKTMRENIDKPLEVHFHNNFGMAVANTIMSVLEGGEVIHSTVTGIGEGGGNCPMIEAVMALRILYGIDIGLKYERLNDLSTLIYDLAGKGPNRPFVGEESYDVESGMVVSWHRNSRATYPTETVPIDPALIGHRGPRYVMGKKSGIDSVWIWADRLNIELHTDQAQEVLRRVKQESHDRKSELSESDFTAIVEAVKAGGSRC